MVTSGRGRTELVSKSQNQMGKVRVLQTLTLY
jgi:hypothetical protein